MEALAKTRPDTTELCMDFRRILKAQQKHSLKRLLQPLSSNLNQKFKNTKERFRNNKKTVEKEAEICHVIEAKEERELMLRDRQVQEFNSKGLYNLETRLISWWT